MKMICLNARYPFTRNLGIVGAAQLAELIFLFQAEHSISNTSLPHSNSPLEEIDLESNGNSEGKPTRDRPSVGRVGKRGMQIDLAIGLSFSPHHLGEVMIGGTLKSPTF
jgi:hypothetical protein